MSNTRQGATFVIVPVVPLLLGGHLRPVLSGNEVIFVQVEKNILKGGKPTNEINKLYQLFPEISV